ncbi:hypothetical protein Bbelb_272030 [Branchiostoma belcheri]|nr:hypothetical protein Bbelb_272030 [Branchiostoma belcheri]
MRDEKITPLVMYVTARLPLPECTKEHSSRDSDEHNMHDGKITPPCAKEHSSRDSDEHNMHDEKIAPLVMYVTARLPLPECTKEHSSRDSDEHNMHDVKAELLVVLP